MRLCMLMIFEKQIAGIFIKFAMNIEIQKKLLITGL
jgi:hypothetical protein